jgi:hypothetical protein
VNQPGLRRSSLDIFRAFGAVLKSANNLVPCVVLVGVLVTVPLALLIAVQVKLLAAATIFVVLLVALVVYIRRNSFGEAAIALVAGLFPALSIDWTAGKFVAFSVAWILLAGLALMIGSVRLAAEAEAIYTEAAIAVRGDDLQATSKILQAIATGYSGQIGPVEKARVLRVFAYTGLTTSLMKRALREVDMLATVIRLDTLTTARFISDLYRMDTGLPEGYLDQVEAAILSSASSPSEFVGAFNQVRHIALSRRLEPIGFLAKLSDLLRRGLPHEVIRVALDD